MSVNLSKGNKISLTKAASDAGTSLGNTIRVGLHWDQNQFATGGDFDLDAMAFLLDVSKKCRKTGDFVFYGNLQTTGVKHMGDERTGASAGDDETIVCDLNALAADGVEAIDFIVNIYDAAARRQNFGMVQNAGVHIYTESGTELISYDLSEDFLIETCVVVGQLYRHNGEWKFNAIGAGYTDNTQQLCTRYGVDIQ